MNFTGRLQIGGYRKDGVVLVGIGDHQMVLLNVVEGLKSPPFDELSVNRYGPWIPCKPTQAARDRIQHLLAQSGNIVPTENIGVLRELPELQLSRQDFIQMFEAANLDIGDTFPDQQTFQEEPDFLQNCLSTIVPQLQASGIAVDDPSGFCALMHMERTGLMPYGADQGEWGGGQPPAPAAQEPPAMASEVPVREPVAGAPLETAGGGPIGKPSSLTTDAAPVVAAAETPVESLAAPPCDEPVVAADLSGPPKIGKPYKKKKLDALGKPAA